MPPPPHRRVHGTHMHGILMLAWAAGATQFAATSWRPLLSSQHAACQSRSCCMSLRVSPSGCPAVLPLMM